MPQGSLSEVLIARFKALFQTPPEWAWPFAPSIPLIGDYFEVGRGLVIYASAENLTWLNEEAAYPGRFVSDEAWNRYRACYEKFGRASEEFFPDVGIAPVSNGGLLAAAYFAARLLRLPTESTPRRFLETVAVTNWCKFSIRSGANQDYIGNEGKITASIANVVTELATMRPGVVMLPSAVWRRLPLREAMRGATPWTRFIPVPQFNATVINCHLRRHNGRARRLRATLGKGAVGKWMCNLRAVEVNAAWRYLAFLEESLVRARGSNWRVSPF